MLEIIKKEMKELGITAYRLSQLTGIHTNMLYRWFNGQTKPSYDGLQNICKVLKLTLKRDDES